MHLVDTTMFYAPEGGGVQRYLTAKHGWFRQYTSVRHTILAPGRANAAAGDNIITLKSPSLPLAHGYRFPLRVAHWSKRLIKLAPDLIEVGDPYGLAWAALEAGGQLRAPVIGFYHSDLVSIMGARFGTRAEQATVRYIRHLYRRFDLVIAPSRFVAEKLQRLGIDHVAQQALGVDTEMFHPQRRDPTLRRKLGLTDDTRLLIYAGRFAHEKHLHVLLSAFRRLGHHYHLLLVGGGMRIRPRPNVTVYRYQRGDHELARLLASSDALVHAGPQETFGLVVLEAMASGLPIVGVAAGGIAELVVDRHGILAPPGDGNAFADAIETLYTKDMATLGSCARETAESSYHWDQVMRSLLELYTSRLRPSR